jgi:hypothetical protein
MYITVQCDGAENLERKDQKFVGRYFVTIRYPMWIFSLEIGVHMVISRA